MLVRSCYFSLPVLSRGRFLPISWKIGRRQVSQNSSGWLAESQRGHRLDMIMWIIIIMTRWHCSDTVIDSSTLLTREHSMDFFNSLPLILSCWQILPRQRFKVPLARGVSRGVAVIMIGLLEIVLILLIATCCMYQSRPRVEHSHWSGGSRSCSHWSRAL